MNDKWGCPPLLYAIWGGAPPDIIQFLISSQKAAFPNHILDWDKMIETLCRAGASLYDVLPLMQIHRTELSEQIVNWQKVARELTIHYLAEQNYYDEDWGAHFLNSWGTVTEDLNTFRAHTKLIQSLQEIQQRFFPDEDGFSLQELCEELVRPLKGWWRTGDKADTHCSMRSFHFLAKCNIAERLKPDFSMEIRHLVGELSWVDSSELASYFDTIHSKLIRYEMMRGID